ncbi:haloacid dehalogenase-like hydrolase [Mesorhizobium sp. B2-8-5]|nr:HAD family hydrolase [Mesorhizobium sp. B2-8-5]UCI23804.1 haloacid dehalogenase-like hydrolase [Mesorhizobium sp. B2-8-5]
MPRKLLPLAICYDFDGTLAPGNMQERDFIPAIGMTKKAFWTEVKADCVKHDADEILIYMKLMLAKASGKEVKVRKEDFEKFGKELELFDGVEQWFARINEYGKEGGLKISHHVISSGIREMISGSNISKYFENIYASSFCYDHHGIAVWPALALNYTTKTQYLFRINKGSHNVYDNSLINEYIPPEERPVPFSNMIYIGDGLTDVPCFRLVKNLGGTSIAVFRPHTKGAKTKSQKMLSDGRVNFIAPADYQEASPIDRIVKATMEKIASEQYYRSLSK